MNCLTCRRRLLISPRDLNSEQRAHIAACDGCSRLLTALVDTDRHVAEAALVPVPDGLSHRVLLARRRKSLWQYASAAGLVFAGLLALFGVAGGLFDQTMLPSPVQAIGPSHPAIAAISLVVEDKAELQLSGNAAEMEDRLKALGLQLVPGEVNAYYGGKCHVPVGACDLIVLDAPDARANVILVPDYPIAGQVLVADRRMIALATPAKAGAYVVVADSPKVVKRMRRLFRRG